MTGLTVLTGGVPTRETTDGDVAICIDDECSKGSVEMSPPADETWTGVIEYRDGSGVLQTPAGGQTITGGGSGNIQLALSSPNAYVRRAFVVEGYALEGPVVAEAKCETSDKKEGTEGAPDDCGTKNRSEAWSRSVNIAQSSRTGSSLVNGESTVRTIRRRLGLD